MPRAQKFFTALLTIAILTSYLGALGSYPLTERSEARYVDVAWEMLRTGDLLTPRYNGIKHFHKPPLFYWSTAASLSLFGINETAARLPCALSALGTLVLVFAWARRRDLEASRAWLAPACLATAPMFWEMGRVATTDMLLTLFVTATLACAWSLMSEGSSAWRVRLFWLFLGFGFLTKGPVAPLIVGLAILPSCLRGAVRPRLFFSWSGVLLASMVALPWYLWVCAQNPGLLEYFLRFQTVDRVLTTVHDRTGPPWFYLPIVLGGLLPWSLWLPQVLLGAKRRAQNVPSEEVSIDLFLLSWALLPVLFFSCIGSKLPPYVLPTFPAVALLLARHFSGVRRLSIFAPLVLFGLAATACAGQIVWGWWPRLEVFHKELGWAAIWLSVAVLVSVVLSVRREPADLSVMPVIAMLGLFLIAFGGMSQLERLSARPIAQAILANRSGPAQVGMHGGYLFGLPYYIDDYVTHVEYPREDQFETDRTAKQRIVPTLEEYIQSMRRSPNDSFLILPTPMLEVMTRRTGSSVIYRGDKWGVLKHTGGSR